MMKQFLWKLLRHLRRFDFILFGLTLTLTLFGLGALTSINAGSENVFSPQLFRQMLFALSFPLLAIGISFFNYRSFFSFSLVSFGIVFVSLLGVLLLGQSIRGSRSWFDLGFINFQPVELAKIALILVLARYFSLRVGKPLGWSDIGRSAGILAIALFPVLLQPDLGSALILLALWLSFLLFTAPARKLIILLLVLLTLSLPTWFFALENYQKARVVSLLYPKQDPLGASYNVAQAAIAIGSGGIFGQGMGRGTVSGLRFLPEAETDFIFAVFGEAFGFIGIAVMLFLWLAFFFLIFRKAKRISEAFGSFIMLGFAYLVAFEVVLNIGMNLGFFPVVGIGLPFLSYGGSSLLAHFVGLGIVESVIAHARTG